MRLRNGVLALTLGFAMCSCTVGTAEPGEFDLVEYEIVGPSRLEVTDMVSVTNSGEFPHTLLVTDQSGDVISATPLIQPGTTTEIDLDLETGRYNFTCRIVAQTAEGDIVDHYEEGMSLIVDVESDS